MRVLYLTFDDLTVPYAWSTHVRGVVNGLIDRGHAVRLVCPGGRAPGVRAECATLPPGRMHHYGGSLDTFVREGEAFKADAVYVRGIHGTLTPAKAAERLGKPLVVEVNGLLEHEVSGWRRWLARRSHRFTLARAARVVTVSPLLKAALSERYGFPADRIDVVPNGVDVELFRPGDRDAARRKLGLPLDRPIVLCVASFYPHHALEVLTEAVAKTGALLVLVGKEGVGAGRVDHERVPEYVAAADVCAYVLRAPDRQFGFSPIKVFEYMAGARPVAAATDLEEVRALVTACGGGVAVDLDAARLGEAIGRLLADPAERERLGRKGRAWVEAERTWARAAAGVEEALRRAVGYT